MIRTGMGNKIEHMIAYLLTTFAFTQGYPERSPWQFMTALSICATLLEVGQSIVPGHHAAPTDLAQDYRGVRCINGGRHLATAKFANLPPDNITWCC